MPQAVTVGKAKEKIGTHVTGMSTYRCSLNLRDLFIGFSHARLLGLGVNRFNHS